jgi:hypothetical protein
MLYFLSQSLLTKDEPLNTLKEHRFNMQPMPFSSVVMIPDNTHLNCYQDNSSVANELMNICSQEAGDAIHLQGGGIYLSQKGLLVRETFHLVGCCYETASAQRQGLHTLSRFLRNTMMEELGQECVSIWLNGKMALVFP